MKLCLLDSWCLKMMVIVIYSYMLVWWLMSQRINRVIFVMVLWKYICYCNSQPLLIKFKDNECTLCGYCWIPWESVFVVVHIDNIFSVVMKSWCFYINFIVTGSSKDEAFFDSQPWLDSDCDDDFLSVNGGKKFHHLALCSNRYLSH